MYIIDHQRSDELEMSPIPSLIFTRGEAQRTFVFFVMFVIVIRCVMSFVLTHRSRHTVAPPILLN